MYYLKGPHYSFTCYKPGSNFVSCYRLDKLKAGLQLAEYKTWSTANADYWHPFRFYQIGHYWFFLKS